MVGAAKVDGLTREIVRLAQKPDSIAEINRQTGELAWRRGLVRPSYARVRQIVNLERDRPPEPSWGELLLDVDLRLRDPSALIDKAGGTLPMDEDAAIRYAERRRRRT
ncbi:MAG: hypothetical protein H0X39_03490 [Actinobacteria bacterium]|nr:hypothetical protein [Actinomycetota bacterium]